MTDPIEKLQKAEKVRFKGAEDTQATWAGATDPRPYLDVGGVYDVERVEVHSWHTRVYLTGFDGYFNSVCFEVVE